MIPNTEIDEPVIGEEVALDNLPQSLTVNQMNVLEMTENIDLDNHPSSSSLISQALKTSMFIK